MALERDIDPGIAKRGSTVRYGWSDMVAFATGALMITGGLLTFLYYDGDKLGRNSATQSVNALRFEAPAQPVRNIVTRPQPARPADH
jgi:hypothetical protein